MTLQELPTEQMSSVDGVNVEIKTSRLQSSPGWIKRHPLAVVVGLFLVFLAIEYFSLPGKASIERFRKVNPATSALMEARKAQHRGREWKVAQEWIPLSRISLHVLRAIIVAEDGTFYDHEGFDWHEVRESFEMNWEEGRIARGASTITQQLAKNLFLSTARDPIRKLQEMILTIRLEEVLTKNRILELYLNLIEWGDGIFGVESASQQYFGKSAADLTREEAARLAAVIPSPLKHTPNSDSRYVLSRTDVVLTRMEARGW